MTTALTWLAHTGREPSDPMLDEMDRRWRDQVRPDDRDAPADGCIWLHGPLHALVLAHVDRAAHKRRRRASYLTARPCDDGGRRTHGVTPMSAILPGDPYGPEYLDIGHVHTGSALSRAYADARRQPERLITALVSIEEFEDAEHFHLHSPRALHPLADGTVLPFVFVPHDAEHDAAEATAEREQMLRAVGFTSYTIDLASAREDRLDLHREFAGLLEDVLDEIASIKADAAAGLLINAPAWPIVVLRADQAAHCRDLLGLREPVAAA